MQAAFLRRFDADPIDGHGHSDLKIASTGKNRFLVFGWLVVGIGFFSLLAGCGKGKPVEASSALKTQIVATSPYLEVAARELVDDSVDVVSLVGPGACPGHFDIRPSQIEQARESRLVLRFDFQQAIEKRLESASDTHKRTIVAVTLSGGLVEPATYREACRQIGAALVEAKLATGEAIATRLELIDQRLARLDETVDQHLSEGGWKGRPVVTSRRQEDFCRALGLEVVGTFGGPGGQRPSDLDTAVKAAEAEKARWIIANRPEGRRLADRLADRLGATVIVFENFPDPEADAPFDQMVLENVTRLLDAEGSK